MLWFANPGVLISPDYFNHSLKEIRGMHGYFETDEIHGTGLMVLKQPGCEHEVIERKYLKDVCDEICLTLGVDKPNSNGWERVLI